MVPVEHVLGDGFWKDNLPDPRLIDDIDCHRFTVKDVSPSSVSFSFLEQKDIVSSASFSFCRMEWNRIEELQPFNSFVL